jgi:xanthine dehydrogenase YagS FAD-binding subunit
MTSASMTIDTAAEFRAAGTDLSERRRSGLSRGPLIDITATSDASGVDWRADGSLRIGALTTIEAIASDARIRPPIGVAASALGLATPQIRHLATLGGNLTQRAAGTFATRQLFQEGRTGARPAAAIIFTAWRSTLAPSPIPRHARRC